MLVQAREFPSLIPNAVSQVTDLLDVVLPDGVLPPREHGLEAGNASVRVVAFDSLPGAPADVRGHGSPVP